MTLTMDLGVSHISKDKYLANSSSKRTGRVAMNCFMHLCTHSTNSSIENHAIVYMVYIGGFGWIVNTIKKICFRWRTHCYAGDTIELHCHGVAPPQTTHF